MISIVRTPKVINTGSVSVWTVTVTTASGSGSGSIPVPNAPVTMSGIGTGTHLITPMYGLTNVNGVLTGSYANMTSGTKYLVASTNPAYGLPFTASIGIVVQ